MKLSTNLVLIGSLLVVPAYADKPHHNPPTAPVTVYNSYDDDSDRKVIYLGVAIAAGVCIYHKCWKMEPVKDNDPTRITPDTEKLRIKAR